MNDHISGTQKTPISGTFSQMGVSMEAVQRARKELVFLVEHLINDAKAADKLEASEEVIASILRVLSNKSQTIVGDAIARSVQDNVNASIIDQDETPTRKIRCVRG